MVTVATSDTLTLQWLTPLTPNGIISAYMVCRWQYPLAHTVILSVLQITLVGSKDYDPSFSPDPVTVTRAVSDLQVAGGVVVGVVEGLVSGTTYRVTVRAVNGADRNDGVGEESDETTALTTSGMCVDK